MNQQWLIEHVLGTSASIPSSPEDGREYLSPQEAEAIVDEALNYLGAHGEQTEYTYMRGHRVRLINTLTMIPKADEEHSRLLDIGCYGYMGYWAKRHLGYETVVGIEWHPDLEDAIIRRVLSVGDDVVEFDSLNFDITCERWPIEGEFDTVLFFEVLEHINEDPMGVMERISSLMPLNATLVMSVPNAISYKALREFLVGMPPWTYWFFEPDLRHEPRHCFEYTPIVFQSLLTASGMRTNAFRTIYAYSTPEREQSTLEIARSVGFTDPEMGETMIAQVTKSRERIALRHPDVLYSPDGYYKNIHPRLEVLLNERIQAFRDRHAKDTANLGDGLIELKPDSAENAQQQQASSDLSRSLLETCDTQLRRQEELDQMLEASQAERQVALQELDAHRSLAAEYGVRNADLLSQVNQLLFQSDCGLQRQEELTTELEAARSAQEQARQETQSTRAWADTLAQENADLRSQVNQLLFQSDCGLQRQQELTTELEAARSAQELAQQETQGTRTWADTLAQENADLRSQVNQLLFACDCYLQQINDPEAAARVLRQRRFRWALDRSKAVARKTPVLRTALRPVYRTAKRAIKRRL